ncbi:hypothetical protein E2C01_048843 [Portunus trituberculatus]|uniref:Uncharacterized protein n=1 Tax=Portunus trituberculatus TaxID=210409 RepID=A0A5B7GEG1_PORTR|nr:hypothetical protein [Portunus trituberculatus]
MTRKIRVTFIESMRTGVVGNVTSEADTWTVMAVQVWNETEVEDDCDRCGSTDVIVVVTW